MAAVCRVALQLSFAQGHKFAFPLLDSARRRQSQPQSTLWNIIPARIGQIKPRRGQ